MKRATAAMAPSPAALLSVDPVRPPVAEASTHAATGHAAVPAETRTLQAARVVEPPSVALASPQVPAQQEQQGVEFTVVSPRHGRRSAHSSGASAASAAVQPASLSRPVGRVTSTARAAKAVVEPLPAPSVAGSVKSEGSGKQSKSFIKR